MKRGAARAAEQQARAMEALQVVTRPAPADVVEATRRAARAESAADSARLWSGGERGDGLED